MDKLLALQRMLIAKGVMTYEEWESEILRAGEVDESVTREIEIVESMPLSPEATADEIMARIIAVAQHYLREGVVK